MFRVYELSVSVMAGFFLVAPARDWVLMHFTQASIFLPSNVVFWRLGLNTRLPVTLRWPRSNFRWCPVIFSLLQIAQSLAMKLFITNKYVFCKQVIVLGASPW